MSLSPSPPDEPPRRPDRLLLLILAATVVGWAAMIAKPEAAMAVGAAWGATCSLLGALALRRR
ncbi:hypothetical protein ACGFIF_42975 [Kribbella sp. NPDC049174]|uniref:hypothetical protein n=1 Tax=Kribbella sp. NPDC049174 TaxID=3364112 RepID=UPI003717B587